jgi:hypothetical protein
VEVPFSTSYVTKPPRSSLRPSTTRPHSRPDRSTPRGNQSGGSPNVFNVRCNLPGTVSVSGCRDHHIETCVRSPYLHHRDGRARLHLQGRFDVSDDRVRRREYTRPALYPKPQTDRGGHLNGGHYGGPRRQLKKDPSGTRAWTPIAPGPPSLFSSALTGRHP